MQCDPLVKEKLLPDGGSSVSFVEMEVESILNRVVKQSVFHVLGLTFRCIFLTLQLSTTLQEVGKLVAIIGDEVRLLCLE